ncbi:MAG: PfkB family carbohydrate kinase [Bacteroidales bacterium]|jgi:rfaE bifunctional protein kinase chain/domain|nr:PfkB family carbohydrate kinase [Bacteroidales bacterium]
MTDFFEKIAGCKVFVVGDVMIDAYLTGEVHRVSPEAPVPVLEVQKRDYRLGGAANVVLNLKAMNVKPVLFSVIGDDEKGDLFLTLMQQEGFEVKGIVREKKRQTTIKYRMIGNGMQMLRVDEEDTRQIQAGTASRLLNNIKKELSAEKCNILIFEDYDKGVLYKEMIKNILHESKSHGVMTAVDPKKRNFNHYRGVTLFKPNLKEMREGTGVPLDIRDQTGLQTCMATFAKQHDIDYVMLTLSENGIAVYDRLAGAFVHQPAYKRAIRDVSGAGDTVIAITSLCLYQQMMLKEILRYANIAGGLACEQVGAVSVSAQQIAKELSIRKL